MAERTKGSERLGVFISYSRDDLAFADQLDATLRIGGFDTRLDRTDIHGGERWEVRLGILIRDADTIVSVLSPASVGSDVCAWELRESVRLGKRIIPVACRPLEGRPAPSELASLNYIYFYPEPDKPGSGFGPGLLELVAALEIDLDWLREHTRLLQRASEWDAKARDESRLLFGDSVAEAKAWVARRPKKTPEPTALHYEFIRASEEAEVRRQSEERRQLEEMAVAQDERAKALADRGAALKREEATRWIIAWVIGLVAIFVVAGALVFADVQSRNAAAQARLKADALSKKAEVDDLIRRIHVGTSDSYGKTALEKICDEVTKVTSDLASASDAKEYSKFMDRFLELYYGPMNLIELKQITDGYINKNDPLRESRIEAAMVRFKIELEHAAPRLPPLPRSDLIQLSSDIEKECAAYFDTR